MRSVAFCNRLSVVAVCFASDNDAFSTITTGMSPDKPPAINLPAIAVACPAAMYMTAVSALQMLLTQLPASSPSPTRGVTKVTLRLTPRRVSDTFSSALAANFFLCAAEQHRIAAFQPHDNRILARSVDQSLVDESLQCRMLAAAFADRDFFGTHCERERVGMHQCVVEHNVGIGQHARSAQRQQIGRARARANKMHYARLFAHNYAGSEDTAKARRRNSGCGRSTDA
jgi:hypothetical protein